MRFCRAFGLLLLLASMAGAPALALGPVDIELGAGYWDNDLEAEDPEGSLSDGAAAPFVKGAVTFGRFGLRAAQYKSESNLLGDAEYQSLDFMIRLFKLSENNRLSVGAGVQRFAFDPGDADDSTTGPRLAAEGRVGLIKLLFLYGEAAYYTELSDMNIGGTTIDDLSGFEWEAGLALHPFPFLWINAGYRTVEVEGKAAGSDLTLTSDGYLAGVLFKF